MGLRLRWLCDGSDRLNWRDLWVMVREADQSSAVARHLYPEVSGWGTSEELLASILDTLAGANWQRGGGKGQRPTPVSRPWQQTNGAVGAAANTKKTSNGMFGDGFEMDSVSLEEMNAWLGMPAT